MSATAAEHPGRAGASRTRWRGDGQVKTSGRWYWGQNHPRRGKNTIKQLGSRGTTLAVLTQRSRPWALPRRCWCWLLPACFTSCLFRCLPACLPTWIHSPTQASSPANPAKYVPARLTTPAPSSLLSILLPFPSAWLPTCLAQLPLFPPSLSTLLKTRLTPAPVILPHMHPGYRLL